MIVPLKIEELPYAFEAQFDLGACSTMIYGKAFAPYLAMASDIREKIDTTQTVSFKVSSYPASPTFRSNWTVWSFRIDVLFF